MHPHSIFTHISELIDNPDLRTKYGNAAAKKVHINKQELEQFLQLISPAEAPAAQNVDRQYLPRRIRENEHRRDD